MEIGYRFFGRCMYHLRAEFIVDSMYNLVNPENNLSGLLGAFTKKVLPLHREKLLLTHGVIGNTADFGSVI